ncbi:MAG: universal stress protein [Bacteroidales bacterium]|nr:universal stress protein [Bacteroidales bacterium]
MSSHLLIPVDFSDRSMLAVAAGFHFASILDITPVLMHVYPEFSYAMPMQQTISGLYDLSEVELTQAIEEQDIQKVAEKQFAVFRHKIRQAQQECSIADVNFTSTLQEGIPEEVILEYCRENAPRLVVMSTRGISKKAEELIGSVTAEVLDSCRVPVFTVPEKYDMSGDVFLHRIMMFCGLDSYDIDGLEKMMSTFKLKDVEVWLMPIENKEGKVRQRLSDLHVRLSQAWPDVTFHVSDLRESSIGTWVDKYIHENNIQLVIAPNRKTSIFTRLFRPTVAHQCLFSVDTPMLALPVSKTL